jgi:radical SAM superfamily enzyme YgiQ (UPF0313 family)
MELSLREMRARGYYCEITEHYMKLGKVGFRKDLFGFADILCLGNGEIVVVQTTSRSNMSARIKKITESETVAFVRKAGIRILVQGWDAKGKLKETDLS